MFKIAKTYRELFNVLFFFLRKKEKTLTTLKKLSSNPLQLGYSDHPEEIVI